jgi:four helix bundle protein
VWNLSLEELDPVYAISEALPREEDFNLKSQTRRAATSVALNIAEGSTRQTDAEQSRFVGHAIRSLTEVVGCLRIQGIRPILSWKIAPQRSGSRSFEASRQCEMLSILRSSGSRKAKMGAHLDGMLLAWIELVDAEGLE